MPADIGQLAFTLTLIWFFIAQQQELDALDLCREGGSDILPSIAIEMLRFYMCREDGFALPPPAGGLRRPSSFDLAGDMEDMRGMADEHTEEEQRIALGQSPSDGGGGGYGSAEADKAAARLQQLGVTVSPPGRTGAIDWQSLAGEGWAAGQILSTA